MITEDLVLLTKAHIKCFLENAPLYSWRQFKYSQILQPSLYILEIDSYCQVCDQIRPFHDRRPRGGGAGMKQTALRSGTSYFEFECVSCSKSMRRYMVEQVVDLETIKIQKFGELPRGSVPRDKILQKFLKDDRDNYEKAVICLSHEYGVAAFAYYRRIIECNISRLLDLIQEDAQASGEGSETLEAIKTLREGAPMSDKIKIANLALPSHLQPDGLNPLGRLYQVLSEGVHSLSDAECLKKAKATSECLTFLVSELASRKEHRARFKSLVGEL